MVYLASVCVSTIFLFYLSLSLFYYIKNIFHIHIVLFSSLAYSESLFVVPWVVTLSPSPEEPASHSRLRILKVSFHFSGSDILQVKWDGTCKSTFAHHLTSSIVVVAAPVFMKLLSELMVDLLILICYQPTNT
jgi:hypothetical protein